MKKHKTIQFIAAALFIASACTDDRDNLMVNDHHLIFLHDFPIHRQTDKKIDTHLRFSQ